MKKLFDLLFSFIGLVIFSPLFLIISIAIKFSSKGKIFFKQKRIGIGYKEFTIYKFRTMHENSGGIQLTTKNDDRVTSVGKFLRKFKLDELPQLINVLIGNMSFVGPRPEVKKYADRYKENEKQVFNLKPGITDYASIKFINENELLDGKEDPEKFYLEEIVPKKVKINLDYAKDANVFKDIVVIFKTIFRVIGN
ncbi:MAG: hypothetical protein CSB16_00380 [Clostridiales bacterium]|nr:MAG: hypothetical protein CSB16_00380 [Clostridiales bacterium]